MPPGSGGNSEEINKIDFFKKYTVFLLLEVCFGA